MTTRAELHAIVDRLPDAEVEEAAAALRDVSAGDHIDDLLAADLDEGLSQARRGEGRPAETVLRELEL